MANNGQLPPAALAPIAQGQLRRDCAAAWNSMNVAARAGGCELLPTGSMSSYRTLTQQRLLYARYRAGTGSLAAVPGQSNHGWGLAVDVATHEMRAMIDRIGTKWGWSKRTSDAQSEWWHLKWVEGSWRGPDPGPYGTAAPAPAPAPPPGIVSLALGTMPDGRAELFAETATGEIFRIRQAEGGGWEPGWHSLGTPGR
jgi:hypothetical protein